MGAVNSVAFSPDGHFFSSGMRDYVLSYQLSVSCRGVYVLPSVCTLTVRFLERGYICPVVSVVCMYASVYVC